MLSHRLITLRFFSSLLLVLAGSLAISGYPAYAQPAATYAVPSAVRPGAELEVEVFGDARGPLHTWTSFPATVTIVEQDPAGAKVKFKIAVPADAPLGIGGMVLGNAGGATDTLWMMLDDLSTVADQGTNHVLGGSRTVVAHRY